MNYIFELIWGREEPGRRKFLLGKSYYFFERIKFEEGK
jgi:hypothetical protein